MLSANDTSSVRAIFSFKTFLGFFFPPHAFKGGPLAKPAECKASSVQ